MCLFLIFFSAFVQSDFNELRHLVEEVTLNKVGPYEHT